MLSRGDQDSNTRILEVLTHSVHCTGIGLSWWLSQQSACNAGDLGSIPGPGRSLGEGNGNPFWYSCLENSMDRGAWRATHPWGRKELDMTEQLTLSNQMKAHRRCQWKCPHIMQPPSSCSSCIPASSTSLMRQQ